MKAYNPSAEERAFLYQEAHALEPMMKDLGSLSVLVEEVVPNDSKISRFRVTFMVAPESVGMRVQATGTSLFDAAIAAKDEAIRQLSSLLNALPPQTASEEPPGSLH